MLFFPCNLLNYIKYQTECNNHIFSECNSASQISQVNGVISGEWTTVLSTIHCKSAVPIQNIHEYSRYFWGLRHVYCSHVWDLTWISTDQWVMLGSPEYNANKHLRCLLHIRPSSLTSRNPDAAGLIVFRESHHCSDQHLCHMGAIWRGSRVDDSSQMAVGEIRNLILFSSGGVQLPFHSFL